MKAKRLVQAVFLVLTISLGIFVSCDTDDNKNPTVTFVSPLNDQQFNIGDTVFITVQAIDSDGSISNVKIYINNDQVFSEINPPYQYVWITENESESEYTIKAVAEDNGSGSKTKEIEVALSISEPKSDFSLGVEVHEALVSDSLEFIDKSLYKPTTWYWDFGDGTQSTEQNPVHVYQNTGQYDVSLVTTNAQGTNTVVKENFITIIENTVTDFDGNEYNMVQIGKQIWTKENLKSIHYSDGEAMPAGSYLSYSNNDTYIEIYGLLYTQEAALRGGEPDTQMQGACPDGWHIPNESEWFELADYLGGIDVAGGKMKESGLEHWNTPNTGATNESGFSALGAGEKYENNFIYLKGGAHFWSSTDKWNQTLKWYLFWDSNELLYKKVQPDSPEVISIRCIKDDE